MSFGDLAAKHQADPGAARLGGKEGNEQVRGIGKARPLVDNPDIELCAFSRPANENGTAGLKRRVRRIPNQVYQQLLQLVSVGRNDHVRTVQKTDPYPGLEFYGPADPYRDGYRQ